MWTRLGGNCGALIWVIIYFGESDGSGDDDGSSSDGSIPYDAFRHFKRVYFLGDPEPEKRLVAVFSVMGDFTFYGDESFGDVDAYSVAGYLASVERWESFIKEWKQFRQDEGFTILHKRLLEHNTPGSEFEWPNLSKSEKYEKKNGSMLARVTSSYVTRC